ncbi:MCE family protein [Nocardioides sp.]|uniref:MCE family protein n=1 Tax=Nocardioides sp. TaxID=35761 RepID=UPI001A193D1F|nr:MCE family protein [Nocardioides sp.]MBJ7356838.1 MCE family protein [Nocardioides sp.]
MRPVARLRTSAALLAAGAVLLSGCEFDGAYDLPLPGSPVDEDNSFEVTAEFADILNVVPRSPVMVDDVVVGEVTDVERVGWHAQVTLRVRDDVELPDDAIADIRQVSLLGEKYVALEAPESGGSDSRLGEGDKIPLAATGRNPEVEEVLGALSFLLSGGGVAQLGTIVEELNNVMSGREDRLRVLLGSLEDVVGTLDAQKADIIRALEAMNNLTATLNAEKKTVTDALDATGPAIEVLADQEAELVEMLSSLDRLGEVGTRVIRASKDNLIKSLENLEPVLSQLSAAGDELAPGINLLVSFPFPDEASDVVKGDYANTSIRAEISLDNFLTGGGGDSPIELPPIELPDPGEVLNDVQKCLQSGNISSAACKKVLADLDSLTKLKKQCKKEKYQDNPVCVVLNQVPDLPLDELPDVLDDVLGGVLGRAATSYTPSGTAAAPGDTNALFGGLS